MGKAGLFLEAMDALASVAELASVTPEVRVHAIQALGNHWPQSQGVLTRIAESGSATEVTAAARRVLAEHEPVQPIA